MKKCIDLFLCLMIFCGCQPSQSNVLNIQNNTTTPFYGFHIHCVTHDQTIEDHVITNADQSYFDEKTILLDKSDFNQYKDIKVYAIMSHQDEIKIHQSSLLLKNYSNISLEGNQRDGFFFMIPHCSY